jgi:outer membrane protein assembly factor BamE (lipoprotein component of BamABCDE complex)
MFHNTNLRFPLNSLRLSLLLAAFLLCSGVFEVSAQEARPDKPADAAPPSAAQPAAQAEPAADAPAFQEYRGVRIGMTADEARRKLGSPTDKSDTQDFYLVSEKESVQVMYDGAKKVSAIALIYMNAGANAPTAKAVMGTDIEAKPDGSLYKLVRYPKAGYWVSYSRTAGAAPIVSITMQKIN